MATSSTIINFLSFFLPTKQPTTTAQPPLHLNFPPSPTPFPSSCSSSSSSSSSSHTHKPTQPVVSNDSSSSCSSELSSVICPSLAYSNTLFFRSPYNVQVVVGDDDPEDSLVDRFRREVLKAGVIQDCKGIRHFENNQQQRKRKSREAAKRNPIRRPMSKSSAQNKQDLPTTNKEGDNWDLPEGDTLY